MYFKLLNAEHNEFAEEQNIITNGRCGVLDIGSRGTFCIVLFTLSKSYQLNVKNISLVF
jgi:hypothetical protein